MTMKAWVILILALEAGLTLTSSKSWKEFSQVPKSLLQELFDKTVEEQTKEDVPLIPLKQFHRQKGVYHSGVKLNFHGKLEMAEMRRLLDVFDNNMFVTAWVTSSLLEGFRYGETPRPTDDQLTSAINSFLNHKDNNKPYNTSIMCFWPQSYNETVKYWHSAPVNLLAAFDATDYVPLEVIDALLRELGLGDLVKYVNEIMHMKAGYTQAFHIPPDFDDTFVNLGLGSLLYQMKEEFPVAWKLWDSHNTNVTSVFNALKKYAYRPFSSDRDLNSIDPRSYMHIRHYLDDAKLAGLDVALVPTWIQSITELRTEFYKGVIMPFQINNIDITVCANTIFGITASVLSGLVSPKVLEDPSLAQIYHNTSALIAYEIKTNLTNRPDLALLYYPSQIEFDWFVSRTFALLEDARKKGPLPAPVMETVYQILKTAATGSMTKYILSQGKHDEQGGVYYDDFLGDGDITHDNRTLERGEDRIFTTAMAVNALLYTWTKYNETTKKSNWKTDVPTEVKTRAAACVKWLVDHTLDGNYDPWNDFFSGSAKGPDTFPMLYPANRYEYLNGTTIHDKDKWVFTEVMAVEGYIPREKFDAMLKEKHFGRPTPLDFHGYNAAPGFFPLWSSVPYTYASTLLALSRYDNIVN